MPNCRGRVIVLSQEQLHIQYEVSEVDDEGCISLHRKVEWQRMRTEELYRVGGRM